MKNFDHNEASQKVENLLKIVTLALSAVLALQAMWKEFSNAVVGKAPSEANSYSYYGISELVIF